MSTLPKDLLFDENEQAQELIESLSVQAMQAQDIEAWADYAHIINKLAEAQLNTGQQELALSQNLWLLALDLNGPSNIQDMPPELRKDFPAFDEGLGYLASDKLDLVNNLCRQYHIDWQQMTQCWQQKVVPKWMPILPLTHEQAWEKISAALLERLKLTEQH